MTSPLRDLAARIEDLARQHPAYSQAWQPVRTLVDHLSALAGMEEANRKQITEPPFVVLCKWPACRMDEPIAPHWRYYEGHSAPIENCFCRQEEKKKAPEGVVFRRFRTKSGVEYVVNDEPVLK